jgi:hypothetical protein
VVNPTATICALALRAAEHLRDNFRELRGATKSDPVILAPITTERYISAQRIGLRPTRDLDVLE